MYLSAIFLTLVSGFFILLTGNFIGSIGVTILSLTTLIINTLLSLMIFYEVALCGSVCCLELFKWIDLGFMNVDIGLFFDQITSIMLLIICFISMFVHMYSIEYMQMDPSYIRYMAYLALFTFFMLLLVSADNFIQMFIGWEGVGLSSYLLISFWYTRILANKAAIKAMLVNRLGDICLLISISLIYIIFVSFKYTVIFSLIDNFIGYHIFLFGMNFNLLNLCGLFLFLGAMGKSAQIGLHIWLPEAMEGPTPVSALIHAATMVTAGVFLIIRCSFIFEYIPNILFFIALIGGLTCFLSSVFASFQFDIKKIVAYSTCSQLGYMFFSCSLSNYNIALFHLFNHAFFKALLFLSMGSIIHAMSDEQDFRKMGGLLNLLPFTYVMVIIGSLSLLAMPYLTGFYSKDFILESAIYRYSLDSFYLYILGVTAAFFTALYSTRLIYWVFITPANFFKSVLINIHEPGFFMMLPMFFLSFCSIYIGFFFSDSFIGLGTFFWNNSIYISILNYTNFDVEFGLFLLKFIPLVFTILGIYCFYIYVENSEYYDINFFRNYFICKKWYRIYILLYKFFNKAMMFDYFFINKMFYGLMKFSYYKAYKYYEKGLFEYIGPIFIYMFIFYFFKVISKFNTGLVYNYIELIISFFLLFILIFQYTNMMLLYFALYFFLFAFYIITLV